MASNICELKTLFIYVKYHIDSTFSMITNYKRNAVRNNTMRYSRSLMHTLGGERSINNNSIRNNYFYPDSIAINSLDKADGLKKLLTKYGFTLDELLNIPPSELAEFLGIDKYVAQIVGRAAKKLSNIDKANDEVQPKNCVTF